MGVLLLVAAGIMRGAPDGSMPGGGDALGLSGARLAIGIAGNFVLGALMTLGIGLYAPCMILVALLGHERDGGVPDHDGLLRVPDAGGSGPVRALGALRPARRAGPDAGGHAGRAWWPGFSSKSLPLHAVKWLVVGVVVYTAVAMLRSAARERGANG